MSLSFRHTIPLNHSCQRPSHVLFADVESHVIDTTPMQKTFEPFLWCLIYKRYRRDSINQKTVTMTGNSISDFWDNVEDHTYSKVKTYLVTHHLEVDFMPLKGFIELRNRDWQLDRLISHGRVLVMWWKKGTRSLVIMNNGNLFDGSIEEWGKVVGLEKLEMPDETGSKEAWDTYCTRDTEIMVKMWDLLLEFMDYHDLGNFKLTKAGLALNAFKHRFMKYKIAVHDNQDVIELERSSYKGGRFEALKVGTFTGSHFYSLDINSMYGWIEKTYDLPYELRGYNIDPTMHQLETRLKRYSVIAEVMIECPENIFPHKENEKVSYAPGTFVTSLTTPELQYCLDRGYLKHVYRFAWYYRSKVLFEFADYFLQMKAEYERIGNKPMRQVAKLYLNSLYGKFAQHGYEDKVIGTCNEDEFEFIESYDYVKKERFTISKYGGKIHQTVVTPAGYNTFVALASHITAYGRLYLYSLMQTAGLENCYHVATDSIVTNQEGYSRLSKYINAMEPGYLKIDNEFDDYTVKDVNDTIQGIKVKIKGVPRKAEQIGENRFRITTWPRLVTLLKNGILDHYFVTLIDKTLARPRYYQLLGIPNPDIRSKKKGYRWDYIENEEAQEEISNILAELEALTSSRKLSPSDMFTFWDYRNGCLRKQRSSHNKLYEFEYADVEERAKELGFNSVEELITEIETQVQRDQRVRQLRLSLKGYRSAVCKIPQVSLLEPVTVPDPCEVVPF